MEGPPGISHGLLDWLLGRQLGLEVPYPVAQHSDPHFPALCSQLQVMRCFVGHKLVLGVGDSKPAVSHPRRLSYQEPEWIGSVYVCICVCALMHAYMWGERMNATSTRVWQTDIIGQVLFFWKILEVHLQGVCSALLSPFRDTLFVFQIRGL